VFLPDAYFDDSDPPGTFMVETLGPWRICHPRALGPSTPDNIPGPQVTFQLLLGHFFLLVRLPESPRMRCDPPSRFPKANPGFTFDFSRPFSGDSFIGFPPRAWEISPPVFSLEKSGPFRTFWFFYRSPVRSSADSLLLALTFSRFPPFCVASPIHVNSPGGSLPKE